MIKEHKPHMPPHVALNEITEALRVAKLCDFSQIDIGLQAARDLFEQLKTAQTDARDFYGVTCVYEEQIKELKEQLEVLREALGAIATGTVPPTYGSGAYSHRSLAREALNRVSIPASEPTPLQRAYGGKVRTVSTDASNQDKEQP